MKKELLSGNESIARGAYEAGVTVGTGYPGTPSTEILENLTRYPGVYTEWSVNEKVALEVAIGASLAGARTLVTMKHVGVNVAADPLFTSSYIGVKGGLVIVTADDPSMHSSQNEQDSRHYAAAAKIPMLEPSGSQEARDFTARAFEISEQYDTPVFVRTTTRVSHSKGVVTGTGERTEKPVEGFQRNITKYVMIPAFARQRHAEVEKRLARLEEDCNGFDLNTIEYRDTQIGVITSGIAYEYIRETLPDVSVLKLGMVNPLPWKLIDTFIRNVKQVFVVEELDPFLETRLKARGYQVIGKELFPLEGELTPDSIREKITGEISAARIPVNIAVPQRPPSLCPGCPHRKVFSLLNREKVTVTGDIGCYTLGVLPPFSAMDTCVDMGASIGVAQGIEIAEGPESTRKTVAVIGDSTFAHSGITGLINAAYNKRNSLIIVLDNGTTAMTGMQPNPLSGETIAGEQTSVIDYARLAEAVGIRRENIRIVDAYKDAEIEDALTTLLAGKQLSLMVVQGLCVILRRKKKK